LLFPFSSSDRFDSWGRGQRLWGRSWRKTTDKFGSVGATVFRLVLGWCQLGDFDGSRSV
jgi:hypothetical protein